jgi:hypothetical protein
MAESEKERSEASKKGHEDKSKPADTPADTKGKEADKEPRGAHGEFEPAAKK